MKFKINFTFVLCILTFSVGSFAEAKMNIVTTVPDLRVLASEIGGDEVEVSSIAKGTQDPHYIEAKPSYMSKASKADLVLSIGLELEIGYLPPILQGARNPKVMPGAKGYLEVGQFIQPLELATGKVTRAEGDVHPFGNPHFLLDPSRVGQVAVGIAERMGELDPAHAASYLTKAKNIQSKLEKKAKLWEERIKKTKINKIVTYHKTLTYFFERFHIENTAILEPKPGIPPTASHILEVIETIKRNKISLVMIENFFDTSSANRIKEEVPGIRVVSVPVSVDGEPEIKTVDELFEKLVSIIEGK